MNKQERIVAIIRREFTIAMDAHYLAYAERAAAIAGANAWDEFHPDDGVGGFSRNPYNLNAADKKENDARIHKDNMRDAYEFAVDTFLKS